MKKWIMSVALCLSFSTAYANDNFDELQGEQKQLANTLLDLSVSSLNFGKIMEESPKKKLLKAPNKVKEACLSNKLSSTGFTEYESQKVYRYVINRNSQQIQSDIEFLTPDFIQLVKSIFQSQYDNATAEQKKSADRLMELHPNETNRFSLLMFDDNYSGLKHTLNLGNSKQSVGQFLLWSLGECHVEINELSDK